MRRTLRNSRPLTLFLFARRQVLWALQAVVSFPDGSTQGAI